MIEIIIVILLERLNLLLITYNLGIKAQGKLHESFIIVSRDCSD